MATGEAIVRARTHLGSATYHVDKIIPGAQGDAKVHAESAKVELSAADDAAQEAEDGNNRQAKIIGGLEATVARIKGGWRYKIGNLIVGGISLIVGGWIVLGLLGSLVPYGWGRTILNFLPFANPFTWIYNRRTAPAVASHVFMPPVFMPPEPPAGGAGATA
jgi:hypothetical protein